MREQRAELEQLNGQLKKISWDVRLNREVILRQFQDSILSDGYRQMSCAFSTGRLSG